ncbi:unnamed protein product [Lupinus luteus]|uniref:RRM domain-containing protein n=1 Tax=Lupinus luteus TaxID=3873 RepID=A0AAV1WMR7_LUPLU
MREREHWREIGFRKNSNPLQGNISNRPPLRDSTTFFFSNFPADHGAKEMWEIFQKWGKVVDVVIPLRLDKYGKKFGLVRFQDVKNSKQMVEKLDRIWIDLYKIWVNLPKFQRGQVVSRIQSSDKPGKDVGKKLTFKLRDGRNFAEVVKNGPHNPATSNPTNAPEEIVNPSKESDFVFNTAEETPLWLRNSYIGLIPDQVDIGELKEKLLLDGFYSVHLIQLGGRTALLRVEEDGEMEALLHDERAWFENKFVSIRKWKPMDIAMDRFFSIRCFGILLHVWEEEFFEKIALQFGKFMGIDDCTRFRKNLKYGCIFIASPYRTMVDKAISVKINGVFFDIQVTEERAACWHHNLGLGSTSTKSSSGDGSSSESGYSWLDHIYDENVENWVAEEEDDDVAVGKNKIHPTSMDLVSQAPLVSDPLGSDPENTDPSTSKLLTSELIPLEPLELNGDLIVHSSPTQICDNGPTALNDNYSELMIPTGDALNATNLVTSFDPLQVEKESGHLTPLNPSQINDHPELQQKKGDIEIWIDLSGPPINSGLPTIMMEDSHQSTKSLSEASDV